MRRSQLGVHTSRTARFCCRARLRTLAQGRKAQPARMKTTPKAQLRPLAATPQLRTRGPNSLETSPPATFSTPQIGRAASLHASPGGTPKLSDFRLEMQQAKANLDEQMAFTRARALDASTAPTSMQRRASRGGGVSSTASRAAALASHDGKRLAACQTTLSTDRLERPAHQLLQGHLHGM